MKIEEVHQSFFNQTEGVLFFICDREGIILEANPAGIALMGDPINASISQWAQSGPQGKLDPYLLSADSTKRHRVNFSLGQEYPETYYFRFLKMGEQVACVGEANHKETMDLRNSLVAANQELNNLARDLHKNTAELKKLNETKNQFLGMAAHDLRNPLGAIQGYARILNQTVATSLPPKKAALLERIKDSAEFMLRLLNDLLDISKIESGKLNLKIEAMDLGPLLQRSVDNNSVVAEDKNINIVYTPNEGLNLILGDSNKLEQVINNLLSNAIKYSQANTQTTVVAKNTDTHVEISVKDQGQGIPLEEQAGLFGEFNKTSVQSTDGEKSTGLGLAIVKKIVNAHGGKIWVESEPGQGSTFAFSIPLVTKQVPS